MKHISLMINITQTVIYSNRIRVRLIKKLDCKFLKMKGMYFQKSAIFDFSKYYIAIRCVLKQFIRVMKENLNTQFNKLQSNKSNIKSVILSQCLRSF